MGSSFHQLCPKYSGTLTLTAPTAIRLRETFILRYSFFRTLQLTLIFLRIMNNIFCVYFVCPCDFLILYNNSDQTHLLSFKELFKADDKIYVCEISKKYFAQPMSYWDLRCLQNQHFSFLAVSKVIKWRVMFDTSKLQIYLTSRSKFYNHPGMTTLPLS